jgi:hypothetical protein
MLQSPCSLTFIVSYCIHHYYWQILIHLIKLVQLLAFMRDVCLIWILALAISWPNPPPACLSREVPGWFVKFHFVCFLPLSFQFIVHSHNAILLFLSIAESVINWTISKLINQIYNMFHFYLGIIFLSFNICLKKFARSDKVLGMLPWTYLITCTLIAQLPLK